MFHSYIGENVSIGKPAYEPRNAIVIGSGSEDRGNNSIIIGVGEDTKKVPKDKNICIGTVFQANSKTQEVTFPGVVTFEKGIITMIGECVGCENVNLPGVYDAGDTDGGVCIECIKECVLHYRARQSWLEKTGDPIPKLQKEVDTLGEKIYTLTEEMVKISEAFTQLLKHLNVQKDVEK